MKLKNRTALVIGLLIVVGLILLNYPSGWYYYPLSLLSSLGDCSEFLGLLLLIYPAVVALAVHNKEIVFVNALLGALIYLMSFSPGGQHFLVYDEYASFYYLFIIIVWLGLIIGSLRAIFIKHDKFYARRLSGLFIIFFIVIFGTLISSKDEHRRRHPMSRLGPASDDISEQYTASMQNARIDVGEHARPEALADQENYMNSPATSDQPAGIKPQDPGLGFAQ